MAGDDLTLQVQGNSLAGWTGVSVTRGIERMPSSFEVSMTEKYPGHAQDLTVQPGDPCQVMIGSDLVMTGYVNRLKLSATPKTHTITVSGRSKSQDLVDCSAEWPGGQITGSSALAIAQKLAQPYGIQVNAQVDVGAPIPQFNLTLGETPYSIIERVARYRGLLFYDLPDGTTTLAQAGNGAMASGFTLGGDTGNLFECEANYSDDERFSTYLSFLQAVDTFRDLGDGGNLLATVTDPIPKRHRQKDIIAEAAGASGIGLDVAKQRANWEAARRAGRSYRIDCVADSWRDSAGTIWTPNFTVPLSLPQLKLPSATWLLGEVTLTKDQDGTRASAIVMPQAAFLPEPVLIAPFPADIGAQPGGGA